MLFRSNFTVHPFNYSKLPYNPADLVPIAREQGFPSLEMEGLVGLFGLKSMSSELKEKIAADFRAVAADGSIEARLTATGQAINIGGPKDFVDSIEEQRRTVAATAKAIEHKPKN